MSDSENKIIVFLKIVYVDLFPALNWFQLKRIPTILLLRKALVTPSATVSMCKTELGVKGKGQNQVHCLHIYFFV